MRLDVDLANTDLYAVLGVRPGADTREIRRAYRRLVSISHPDLNPHDMRRAEQRMARINVAAGILIDPVRREAYDQLRAGRGPRRTQPRARRSRPPAPPIDFSRVRLDARDVRLVEHLRTWPSRLLCSFEAWRESWSPEFRMVFLCASVGLALGLIRLARPTSLPSPFEDEKPQAVAASART